MDEGKEAWIGRYEHPLLNNLVLGNVFEYVKKRDLLACRGVCKKWNELSIPFMRSKFIVSIQLSNDSLDQPRSPLEESTRTMHDFVVLFLRNVLGIPFAKFKIGPFCTTDGAGQRFLELCGGITKELHLCQDEEENELFKIEDVSEMLRSMPKLERLTFPVDLDTYSENKVDLFPESKPKPKLNSLKSITLESETSGDLSDCCPTFVEELITVAENISDLTLTDAWRSPFDSVPKIPVGAVPFDDVDDEEDENIDSNTFQALDTIEELGRESRIESLSMLGIKMDPHVELIQTMASKPNGLKLKKLSLSMDEYEEETEHFTLVELFKDTLECLSLFVSCSDFRGFSNMSLLKSLMLHCTTDFDSSLVNLSKIFPSLKELVLYDEVGDQVYEEFLPQSEPCRNVTSFKLGLCTDLFGLQLRLNAFNHMLTLFPRLTELRLEIKVDGAQILRQIWTRLTELKFLGIYGELQGVENIDSLITGISTQGIQAINGVLNDMDNMTTHGRRETIRNLGNQHCLLPSIRNLTKLRRLQLTLSADGNGGQKSYLSDVSGFLGFYSLKHLTQIFVHKCELTKTCCEILRKEMDAGLECSAFSTPDEELIVPDRRF